MAEVEAAVPVEAGPPAELPEAEAAPAASMEEAPVAELKAAGPGAISSGKTEKLGSLTKRTRRPAGSKDASGKLQASPSSAGGGSLYSWNKFNRDAPNSRPQVNLSKYSKVEKDKRAAWADERRAIQERNARLQQAKRDAEQKKKQEVEDQKAAERRAMIEARIAKQQERLRQAAADRERREQAYQDLLERTKEKGLLYNKLAMAGEAKISEWEKERTESYKNGAAKIKKLSAHDIQQHEELHPVLKQAQRRKMDEIQRREMSKPPVAFTAKGVHSSPAGSTLIQTLPGTGRLGNHSTMSAASLMSPGSITDTEKPRKPKKAKRKPVMVDRPTSPIDIPGVSILIDGSPYVKAASRVTAAQPPAQASTAKAADEAAPKAAVQSAGLGSVAPQASSDADERTPASQRSLDAPAAEDAALEDAQGTEGDATPAEADAPVAEEAPDATEAPAEGADASAAPPAEADAEQDAQPETTENADEAADVAEEAQEAPEETEDAEAAEDAAAAEDAPAEDVAGDVEPDDAAQEASADAGPEGTAESEQAPADDGEEEVEAEAMAAEDGDADEAAEDAEVEAAPEDGAAEAAADGAGEVAAEEE